VLAALHLKENLHERVIASSFHFRNCALTPACAGRARRKLEDIMRFAKPAATAAALCLALGASGAYADDEPVNAIGCHHLDKQASQALGANAASANIETAKHEADLGRDACLSGYYKIGMTHYRRVIELLASK
jgi:hypothetical protein